VLGAKLVPFRGGWAHMYSDAVVIASGQQRDFALPAAAWSAYSGDSVGFVNRDSVPSATVGMLVQRQKLRVSKPTIYIVGPSSVISNGVASKLAAYGAVKRVAGPTAADTAVALARYRDNATGFGWGLSRAPLSVSVMNPKRWGTALGALQMAAVGPQAPLLLTDAHGNLPRSAIRYLQDARASASQPSQGYVFGDIKAVPSRTLSQLDSLLEPRAPQPGALPPGASAPPGSAPRPPTG
jgi:hypothetical protein